MSESGALDTIVAPATPVGRSALAIIRIDGPRSGEILGALTAADLPEPRVATFAQIAAEGEAIDECIAIRYVAPHSFTGNDLVELTLHGNPLLIERTIRAAIALGARVAERGEFTERAVLNGKIDLVQAESIGDLIASRTALQAKLSLGNLEGSLSRTASRIRELLVGVISRLEAALDFADEGYQFIGSDEARQQLGSALDQLKELGETYERGRATTVGLTAVILGAPNAGKSTLMNRLVGSDRAIVTPIPGTTRDIVRETIEIGGLPVTIADTAGLRVSGEIVEEIGIAKAREAAQRADLVLYLIDASIGIQASDEAEVSRLARADVMRVFTKTDLAPAPAGEIAVSVEGETGVRELLAKLDDRVRTRFAAPEGSPVIVNARQRAAIEASAAAIEEALRSIESGAEEQIVLVDLYRAATALGLLTGAITHDELFAEIFSKFCIGK